VSLAVGVMARAPSSGGKARLAPHLDASRLAALRTALLADTLHALAGLHDVTIFFTPDDGVDEIADVGGRTRGSAPTIEIVEAAGRTDIAGVGRTDVAGVGPTDVAGVRRTDVAGVRRTDIAGVGRTDIAGVGRTDIAGVGADPRVRPVTRTLLVPQGAGDLGARMLGALQHLLSPPQGARAFQASEAILVGSDIPLLTADHLLETAEILRASGGVVLGPADDGGYYLIGMTRAHAELFDGIEWGTGSVLTDTLRAAARIGVDARLIRSAYDVDTIEDLQRIARDLAIAPATVCLELRRWLSES
jgi:glycosyltransferase A (GT-A) superfamily protein (DUF2064 family)